MVRSIFCDTLPVHTFVETADRYAGFTESKTSIWISSDIYTFIYTFTSSSSSDFYIYTKHAIEKQVPNIIWYSLFIHIVVSNQQTVLFNT